MNNVFLGDFYGERSARYLLHYCVIPIEIKDNIIYYRRITNWDLPFAKTIQSFNRDYVHLSQRDVELGIA